VCVCGGGGGLFLQGNQKGLRTNNWGRGGGGSFLSGEPERTEDIKRVCVCVCGGGGGLFLQGNQDSLRECCFTFMYQQYGTLSI
jgi:hypothetical protein